MEPNGSEMYVEIAGFWTPEYLKGLSPVRYKRGSKPFGLKKV